MGERFVTPRERSMNNWVRIWLTFAAIATVMQFVNYTAGTTVVISMAIVMSGVFMIRGDLERMHMEARIMDSGTRRAVIEHLDRRG